MQIITVLSDDKLITQTKFEGKLDSSVIGQTITTFYDEQKILFGYCSHYGEQTSDVSGQTIHNDVLFDNALNAIKTLVNAIPNLPDDLLDDLRLDGRDEPSPLRLYEYIIKQHASFSFEKTNPVCIDELANYINQARFLIGICRSLLIINKCFPDKKDFIHNLFTIVSQIQSYFEYEFVEHDNDDEDEEKHLSFVKLSVIPRENEYYDQNDNYFNG